MKKFLLLIAISFALTSAYSQNESIENARWVNFEYQYDDNYRYLQYSKRDIFFTTTADTIFQNKIFLKVYLYSSYYGALRVDSLKWYFVPKDSTQEMLLYDFGLHTNDTLFSPYYEEPNFAYTQGPRVVVLADTVNFLGRNYRRVHLDNQTVWIEGVGSPDGLFRTFLGSLSGQALSLACFSKGDSVLWYDVGSNPVSVDLDSLGSPCALDLDMAPQTSSNLEIAAYPNPAQGHLWLEWGAFSGSYTVEILNLDGRLLSTHLVTQTKAQLDLDLSPGLYVLRCRDGFHFSSTVFSVKN